MLSKPKMFPTKKPRRSRDRYEITDAKYAVLRTEIIEAHKSGADFLKWKLIAVAAVSSVAIGFLTPANHSPTTEWRLIVCLIPFICAYSDMVGLDLAVRTMLIAGFLRLCNDPYEMHVANIRGRRDNPFHTATTASFTASIAISVLIIGGGLVGAKRDWDPLHVDAFVAAGGIGIIATLYLWRAYLRRTAQIAPREITPIRDVRDLLDSNEIHTSKSSLRMTNDKSAIR